MTALAMICLDPYYRTARGFVALVEQEWMAVGHKFRDRTWCASTAAEQAPIFVQFLDGVHQLMRQFPCEFEYNEWLLLTMADLLHCNLFGNFLHNTDAARAAANVRETTTSIWSVVSVRGSECHVSKLANSDTCPRPTTGRTSRTRTTATRTRMASTPRVVRARPGRPPALSVPCGESVLYGGVVRARGALVGAKR
jgi:hypothetical protein